MDLKYLATVKAILDEGSFQKAAIKLNYTQSTVTFQIHQLEEELHMRIFERVGRRMTLTQAGRDLLPYIDSALESIERLCNFGRERSDLRGVLRAAMPETILVYKSQPILKRFREQAPHVRLLIHSQNCYITRNQLLNGEIDVAIHYEVGGYTPSIVTKKIADFTQCLVASPVLAPDKRDFITPNQRKDIPLISNDRNCISQEIFDRYLKDQHIYFEDTIELWSIEAIKRSVISDLGVAFLPYFAVKEELDDGRLIELPTALKENNISAVCAYHKNKWISPAIRLFLELVDENAFVS